MRFLNRQSTPAPEPADVVMRFRTAGGAVVNVTSRGAMLYANCTGCGWTNLGTTYESNAHNDSNTHAGECRAMPMPEAQR